MRKSQAQREAVLTPRSMLGATVLHGKVGVEGQQGAVSPRSSAAMGSGTVPRLERMRRAAGAAVRASLHAEWQDSELWRPEAFLADRCVTQ